MKCKNCGETLLYKDGRYMCDSCGGEYAVSSVYEDIDTYICCIEIDETGRRTMDSVMAQEICRTLEQAKIKTFYARISADQLTGDDLEEACKAAMHNAKTVVLLGTQKAHFEKLAEKYQDFYTAKTLIPVFADMNPYDIPKGICAIQALDYGKVGAGVDLVRGIFNALGREETIDYGHLVEKTEKQKQVLFWAVGIFGLLLLAALGCYLYFMGIFDGKPDKISQETTVVTTEVSDPTLRPEEVQENQYTQAIAAAEAGDNVKAMELFSALPGYKDSDKQLQLIYQGYAGYYQNEETETTLHIQIWDGNAVALEFTKLTPSGYCKIIEPLFLQGNCQSVEFNDSENNRGTITLELGNGTLLVRINTTSTGSDVSVGNIDVTYATAEKSDKPFAPKIDRERILQMITTLTELKQVQRWGYELEVEDGAIYKIKNTEIQLSARSSGSVGEGDTWGKYIAVLSAPAGLVIPERNGTPCVAFEENGVLFVPHAKLGTIEGGLAAICTLDTPRPETISADTPVCMVSPVSNEHYGQYKESYIYEEKAVFGVYEEKAVEMYLQTFTEAYIFEPVASVLTENSTHYLVYVLSWEHNRIAFFSVDKNTLEATYIANGKVVENPNAENPVTNDPEELYKKHPEFFGDFL